MRQACTPTLYHPLMAARRRFAGQLAAFGALVATACAHAGAEAPSGRTPADEVTAQPDSPPARDGASSPGGAWSKTGDDVQEGVATWYGGKFAGRTTASGERFDPRAMTAAHRTLAFGTWVEVRRVDTGATVRVRITDRGPFGDPQRIIDLSRGAAERIGLVKSGVAHVELRVVEGP
jgi:peptidoglycan lytic transglycosylase